MTLRLVFSCRGRRVPTALTLTRGPTRPAGRDRGAAPAGDRGQETGADAESAPGWLRHGLRACEVNPRGIARTSVVESARGGRIPRPGRLPSTAAEGTAFSTDAPPRRAAADGPRHPCRMSLPPRPASRLPGLLVIVVLVLLAAGPAAAVESDPRGEWPLRPQPEVTAGFDPPSDPWGAGHRGVDLLGLPGQQVRAALPGRVIFAGRIAGRGVVVVDHGPTRTTYEPVAATRAVGETVRAGGPIGVLELVGSHCFPRACLHWGWVRDETYLDPLRLVGPAPVRLLPLWQATPTSTAAGPAARAGLPYAEWRPLAGHP